MMIKVLRKELLKNRKKHITEYSNTRYINSLSTDT